MSLSLDPPVASDVLQCEILILAYKHLHVWPPLLFCPTSLHFSLIYSALFHLPPFGHAEHLRVFGLAIPSTWKVFGPDINMAHSLISFESSAQVSPPLRGLPEPPYLVKHSLSVKILYASLFFCITLIIPWQMFMYLLFYYFFLPIRVYSPRGEGLTFLPLLDLQYPTVCLARSK